MQSYNPGVVDRSGEITAANNLLGAQGLASGITQAGNGISQAIQLLQAKNQLSSQNDGMFAAYAPLVKSDANPNGLITQHDLDAISAIKNPYAQNQAWKGLSTSLQLSALNNYRTNVLTQKGLQQSAKNTGIMPWSSTPAPGGLGAGAAATDSASE